MFENIILENCNNSPSGQSQVPGGPGGPCLILQIPFIITVYCLLFCIVFSVSIVKKHKTVLKYDKKSSFVLFSTLLIILI